MTTKKGLTFARILEYQVAPFEALHRRGDRLLTVEDVRKYLKSPRDSEDVFHFACVVHDALTCGLSHDTIENAIYEEFCKNTAQHARDR
jgi:hypothetical protein